MEFSIKVFSYKLIPGVSLFSLPMVSHYKSSCFPFEDLFSWTELLGLFHGFWLSKPFRLVSLGTLFVTCLSSPLDKFGCFILPSPSSYCNLKQGVFLSSAIQLFAPVIIIPWHSSGFRAEFLQEHSIFILSGFRIHLLFPEDFVDPHGFCWSYLYLFGDRFMGLLSFRYYQYGYTVKVALFQRSFLPVFITFYKI